MATYKQGPVSEHVHLSFAVNEPSERLSACLIDRFFGLMTGAAVIGIYGGARGDLSSECIVMNE
jgi:hypothetical protein